MPWKVFEVDNKYCVHKMNPDKSMGEKVACHDTEGEASAQMRALYASESKERSDAVFMDTINALSKALDGDESDMKEAIESIIEEHTARIEAIGDEQEVPVIIPKEEQQTKETGIVERMFSILKSLASKFSKKERVPDDNLMLWKEGDTTKWVVRYSNNFRDHDNPPEIISSAAHKSFVEKVDKGLAPLPELWIWHVPEWKIGRADWVAYDESGFAVAGGHLDKEAEWVADALAAHESTIRASHGMPRSTVVYDPQDKSVIVDYESREVSILPLKFPANAMTGFAVLSNTLKEDDMIPKDKRERLVTEWGFSEAQISALEAMNADDAAKAVSEGIESKEQGASEVQAVDSTVTPPVTPAPTEDASQPQPAALTASDVATAVTAALSEALKPIGERLSALEGEVKAVKEAEDARAVKEQRDTPIASLTAMFTNAAKSAIGAPETNVDGRFSLAKSKPAEAQADSNGRTMVPFINDLIAGSK